MTRQIHKSGKVRWCCNRCRNDFGAETEAMACEAEHKRRLDEIVDVLRRHVTKLDEVDLSWMEIEWGPDPQFLCSLSDIDAICARLEELTKEAGE